MDLCKDCEELISNRGRDNPPHKSLQFIDSEKIKIIGQARYFQTKYKCATCNNYLQHENDKNDPIHWSLLPPT